MLVLFESQAAVYNAVHGPSDQVRLQEFASNFRRSNVKQHPDGNDWRLNVTWLKDAWFLYRQICTYSNLKMLEIQDFSVCTVGNRRDIASVSCSKCRVKLHSGYNTNATLLDAQRGW